MVKVLFDHNMPPILAKSLSALIEPEGHQAFALREKFPINISDEDYFKALGKEKDWIVISKDLKNAKKVAEREVILRSGVLAFYLSKGVQKKRVTEQAAIIFWHWENLVLQRQLNARGLYRLPENKGSKFTQL